MRGLTRIHLAVAIAIGGSFLWMFGTPFGFGHSLAFRDTAHYYYPLFEWVRGEWAAGRVPLWSPQDSCGTPILADGSSSVFYPGKLVFALPFSFALAYKLYVTGHILIAAAGAYLLARRWKASVSASGLAAVCYAFGGHILFQYSNVVFLVGAAWLPLALLSVDAMLAGRSIPWAAASGVVLALMTLGGDPQSAYHVILIGALYALLLWLDQRRKKPVLVQAEADAVANTPPDDTASSPPPDDTASSPPPPSACPSPTRLAASWLGLLVLAALFGGSLASIQIFPSMSWGRQSDRAAFYAPRSLYEIPAVFSRHWSSDGSPPMRPNPALLVAEGLLGSPEPHTHHRNIYQFSIGPWRWAELLWPNFSGKIFPTDRHWIGIIPDETVVWTPSLYLGLLPLLLAVVTIRLRGGPTRVRWLSWLVVFALVGSLGWFGIGWVFHVAQRALYGAELGKAVLGEPVGGLYWMLVTALPGYAQFRYPAKLFGIASLGVALLAALGWDQAFTHAPARVRRLATWIALASLTGALIVLGVRPFWASWFAHVRPDDITGPLDALGASNDLLLTMVHTAILAAFFAWLYSGRSPHRGPRMQAAALLLTALDICLANGWMVQTAPDSLWQTEPAVVSAIETQPAPPVSQQPYRVMRAMSDGWFPKHWRMEPSADRRAEAVSWFRGTIYMRHQLTTNVALVESPTSLMSAEFVSMMVVGRALGGVRPDGAQRLHPLVLNALGARYLIQPQTDDGQAPGAPTAADSLKLPIDNAELRFNPDHYPRAWIVHRIEQRPPQNNRDFSEILDRTQWVLFPNDQPRDLRREAVVETDLQLDALAPPLAQSQPQPQPGQEQCQIVDNSPQRVEVEVRLAERGLVVLSDLYAPGWHAHVTTEGKAEPRPVPILRTNRMMRGVYLAPGHHRIVFRYQPTSFRIGAWISALSLLALAGYGILLGIRHRRQRNLTLRVGTSCETGATRRVG